jgi:hypothetical protein
MDGYVVASGLPTTNRIYLGDRDYFKLARDTQKFAMGAYQVGRITGKATLNLAYPIKDRLTDQLRGVIYAALDLNWLNQHAARAELPDGSTLTVVDRHGTILVRYAMGRPEQESVEQSITNRSGVPRCLKSGKDLNAVGAGLDGVERELDPGSRIDPRDEVPALRRDRRRRRVAVRVRDHARFEPDRAVFSRGTGARCGRVSRGARVCVVSRVAVVARVGTVRR